MTGQGLRVEIRRPVVCARCGVPVQGTPVAGVAASTCVCGACQAAQLTERLAGPELVARPAVVCAWCGVPMSGELVAGRRVSHGMCPDCEVKNT